MSQPKGTQGEHAESSPGPVSNPGPAAAGDWRAEVAAGNAAVDDQFQGTGPDGYDDDRYQAEADAAMREVDKAGPPPRPGFAS
jgi:hypothetical protein